MNTQPLVSIIMPSYNSSKYIEESIHSVLIQTYVNWELLITDDNSTDETIEIVIQFTEKDSRIKLFRLYKNSGPGVARNNSINEARGRFIAFLDSDDQWYQDKLEKQILFMLSNRIGLSYTNYDIVNELNVKTSSFFSPKKVTYDDIIKNNEIGCLTAVYDTKIVGKQLMPTIRKRQDWALWLVILKKIPYALGLPDTLAVYKKRQTSVSSNKLKVIQYIWDVYRKEENFSYLKSIYYTFSYFIHYFLKTKRHKKIY